MIHKMAGRWLALLATGCLAVPALAQDDEVQQLQAPEGLSLPAITPNCNGGTVYDDGGLTSAYSIGNGDPGDATMVMKFDLPAGATALDQVCAAFTRDPGGPTTMSFEVVVYNDNGAGGQPGTFLGSQPAIATGIPQFPGVQFYNVAMAGSGIVLPDTSVYIGVRWPGGDLLLAADRSTTTPQRSNFGSGNGGASFTNMTVLFPTNPSTGGGPPRALAVRADAAAGGGACIPSGTAMCLNGNRFRVQATFQTGDGTAGNAQVVKLTNDTGYLWFFNADNVEAVVKVLGACGFNNRYWVFAGGLTDVQVVLTVTDTLHGVTRTFINPQGSAFEPIQDTNAFATCP